MAEGEHLLSKPVSECSLTELLVLGIIQNHPECDPFEPTFGQSEDVYKRQGITRYALTTTESLEQKRVDVHFNSYLNAGVL